MGQGDTAAADVRVNVGDAGIRVDVREGDSVAVTGWRESVRAGLGADR